MPGFEPGGRAEPLWLRASAWVDRAYRAFGVLREELALSRVPARRWRLIAAERYGRVTAIDPWAPDGGLFAWERTAFAGFFPRTPARVLVGGAGTGREVFALAAAGHRVAAFEPAPAPFAALVRGMAARGLTAPAVRAGYEELVATLLDGATGFGLEPLLADAPYDAVVVGWGSVTHVAEADTRRRLLAAMCRLCPRGPVLFSYLEPWPSDQRAARLRGWARRALKLLPGARPVAPGDTVGAYGFHHTSDEAEVRELAAMAGYEVAHFEARHPPHALLKPAGTPMPARVRVEADPPPGALQD